MQTASSLLPDLLFTPHSQSSHEVSSHSVFYFKPTGSVCGWLRLSGDGGCVMVEQDKMRLVSRSADKINCSYGTLREHKYISSINQSMFLCVLYCKTKSEREAHKLTPAAILPQNSYFRCLYRNIGSVEYTVLLSRTLSLTWWQVIAHFWGSPVPEHKKHLHSRWR